jgi:hypothetical protein
MEPGVYPDAEAVNVAFTEVLPAAALNVTFTPCQLVLLSVTELDALVIAVLPAVRAMFTVTEPLGAALSRSEDVPLAPPLIERVAGTKLMTGVLPEIENITVATELSTGDPASYAVAVAV